VEFNHLVVKLNRCYYQPRHGPLLLNYFLKGGRGMSSKIFYLDLLYRCFRHGIRKQQRSAVQSWRRSRLGNRLENLRYVSMGALRTNGKSRWMACVQ
jgi:hypothetical protein